MPTFTLMLAVESWMVTKEVVKVSFVTDSYNISNSTMRRHFVHFWDVMIKIFEIFRSASMHTFALSPILQAVDQRPSVLQSYQQRSKPEPNGFSCKETKSTNRIFSDRFGHKSSQICSCRKMSNLVNFGKYVQYNK